MPKGGGRYEAEAETILKVTQADLVVLLIKGGNRGDGFSLVMQAPRALPHIGSLPDALRHVAQQIESDLKRSAADD